MDMSCQSDNWWVYSFQTQKSSKPEKLQIFCLAVTRNTQQVKRNERYLPEHAST